MSSITMRRFDPVADIDKMARKVEAVVRADVGATTAVGYSVTQVDVTPNRTGRTVKEAFALQLSEVELATWFTATFALPGARRATLDVDVIRVSGGAGASNLRYAVPLGRRVGSRIALEPGSLRRGAQFTGGPEADRLNAVPGLAKRADRLARTEGAMGAVMTRGPKVCVIEPTDDGEGSTLYLATFLRPRALGMRPPTTDAIPVLELAGEIERALA